MSLLNRRVRASRPVPRPHRILGAAVVAVLVVSGTALGSSYVMMTDGDLADRAELIARVEVLSAAPGAGAHTDFRVRIVEAIKGSAVDRVITVRQLGGVDPEGPSLWIHGQSRLRVGAEAMLFLADKGPFMRPTDPLLGVFRVARLGDRHVASRGLEGADELLPSAARESRRRDLERAHLPRDLASFTAWLRDRARGDDRDPDYFLEHRREDVGAVVDGFTLLGDGDPIRWSEFDSGGEVEWVVHRRGLQRGIPRRGVEQVKEAAEAWSGIGAIRYVFAGRAEAPAGFTRFDRINAVAFNDPNDEIEGSFDCLRGGTLALGGPWFGNATYTVRGKSFRAAVGADVIFQDGLECFYRSFGSRRAAGLTAAEIGTHELGHALGLGHSCGDAGSPSCSESRRLDDAIMRAIVHGDDRGARISPDDRRAALGNRGMRYPRR